MVELGVQLHTSHDSIPALESISDFVRMSALHLNSIRACDINSPGRRIMRQEVTYASANRRFVRQMH